MKHLQYVAMIALFLYSCKSEDPALSKHFGKVAFYSNAQYMLEKDTMTISLFVDSVFVGKLRKSSLVRNKNIFNPSDSILIIERSEGKHFVYAKTSLNDTIIWTDTIYVVKDSTIGIFFDGWKYASTVKKFLGTWVEKSPELYDGISDTIVVDRNMIISKHYLFSGRNYKIENNNIIISNSATVRTYKFIFPRELEIYISDFPQRSSLSILRPVYFTKIQQL